MHLSFQSAHGASRHRFLLSRAQNQTSICGLRRGPPSPKIKFGFTCQPRNPNLEASGSLVFPRPVPETARPGRFALTAYLATVTLSWLASRRDLSPRRPEGLFLAIYRHQVSHQFSRYRQRGPVAISLLLLALIHQRQFRIPARRQVGCFDEHRLQMLVSLFRDRSPLHLAPRTLLASAQPAVTHRFLHRTEPADFTYFQRPCQCQHPSYSRNRF